ncbi:hypothetical protein GOZ97_03040 [Agrobacterium vitis]|uniref:hypothetical protein n=1 Tax=Rhizobium/Agrobacterium group TaxID=227290 RepID=UPI0008DC2BB2|nr:MULTISPECIES: hypothetical protein [Rhizobium/Agrobacterium group]MCF1434588.1 hypothetical protein [Allorhizobium ampelinum]MUO88461.1 hypothetical protein [Agrobacterium vitis]MUZ54423.1 hypothetical protein [Agrobacterium vitis]MUZ90385.1 hypothetical protein [Agrobacterium vitis]MVA38999.1 hypothetical protein [Agrobacterium vitis]
MSEGSAWSVDAYEISIQLRSPKTVIVEGKYDKSLVERVFIESCVGSRDVVVDTADMISGDDFSGLGNKDKLISLWSSFAADIKSSGRIIMITDREWDGLTSQDDCVSVTNWVEHTRIGDFQFQTLGHSVENYGFRLEFILEYIKHFGCGLHSHEVESALIRWFPSIVSLAASFSLESKKRSIINRCGGVFSVDHFIFTEGVEIAHGMIDSLESRGIQNAGEFIEKVNKLASEIRANFNAHIHLLAHGHLGEDLIWATVGALLKGEGLSTKVCEELAFSRRDERLRFYHGWLSKIDSNERRPIDELVAIINFG